MKNVGIKISSHWIEFGSSEVLYSWFSSISNCLENGNWGTRFPIIMNNLYSDEEKGIEYKDIDEFKKEILIINEEFSKIKITNAIWSYEENIEEIPSNKPNLDYTSKTIDKLFRNNRNLTMFNYLEEVIETMEFLKSDCVIKTEYDFL